MTGWAGFWIGIGLAVIGLGIEAVGVHIANALRWPKEK